jgi:hypothetical protein
MQKRMFFLMAMWMFPVGMLAQTSTPPVKMGLWQTTDTSTISGMGQMPVIVTQSCFTQAGWQNVFKSMQHDDHCTFTSMKQTATTFTADMACSSGDSSSTTHFDVKFVSTERIQGEAHGQMLSPHWPQPMNFEAHFESVFQGADCKGVSPDRARVIH